MKKEVQLGVSSQIDETIIFGDIDSFDYLKLLESTLLDWGNNEHDNLFATIN